MVGNGLGFASISILVWWLMVGSRLGFADLGLGLPISSFSLPVWWWLTAWWWWVCRSRLGLASVVVDSVSQSWLGVCAADLGLELWVFFWVFFLFNSFSFGTLEFDSVWLLRNWFCGGFCCLWWLTIDSRWWLRWVLVALGWFTVVVLVAAVVRIWVMAIGYTGNFACK